MQPKQSFLKTIFKSKELSIFLVCLLLSILIEVMNPIFFTYSNMMDILRNTSYTLIMAVGMTFVLIAKGLDLSVGSVLALCGLMGAFLMSRGVPVIIAVILALGQCAPSLLTRAVLYTAVTRARNLLIVVGDEDVFSAMVENNRTQKRYSGLKTRLCAAET